jgi:uncharacterized protein YgbK (DUF1537 family)
MRKTALPLSATLAALPSEWPADPLPDIRTTLAQTGQKVVILDDDPTGAQTVQNVPVLTEWSVDILAQEFINDLSSFYVLTNSRSKPLLQARALNAAIGRNLVEAAQRAGRAFAVISRSDSTLRGHFPGELEALADALGGRFDAWIIVPFFLEGGRYTIHDVHYVAEGGWLTPVGETEFARDPSFGFAASNLRQWVEEKTGGRVPAKAVASISLQDLRQGGPQQVLERLCRLADSAVCIANAAGMRDLEVLNEALLHAERQGKRFIYRTAASFIRARLGQSAPALLRVEDFNAQGHNGGLIIVGSYVQRTTDQLTHLLAHAQVASIAVRVADLLDVSQRAIEIERVARAINERLTRSEDVVVYTSRELVTGRDGDENLSIIQRVSEALVAVLQRVTIRPRYLIAKGGNTSSDLATRVLNVKRCMVPGQALPGVPVWELGEESRFPGLKYVVFPGNVGGPAALSDLVSKLR